MTTMEIVKQFTQITADVSFIKKQAKSIEKRRSDINEKSDELVGRLKSAMELLDIQ